MPQRISFSRWRAAAAVFPMQLDRNKTKLGQFSFEGIARLRPGVTLAAANSDIQRLIPTVWRAFPRRPDSASTSSTRRGSAPRCVRSVRTLWAMSESFLGVHGQHRSGAADCLRQRRQSFLVRAGGQASANWQCARHWVRAAGGLLSDFLIESVVIGVLGSALGLGLAFGALRLLIAIAPQGLPRVQDIALTDRAGVHSCRVVVLQFAVWVDSRAALCECTDGHWIARWRTRVSEGRERHRTRNTLVVIQVGLAFVLLICSG